MNPVEMKIGILQAGRCPDDLYARHGDYDGFYKRLLDGNGFETRQNLLPEDIATRGINSLAVETSSTKIVERIVEFFKRDRTPA